MVKKVIITILGVVLFSACDKIDLSGFFFPTGDVVDERFAQSMEMTRCASVAHIDAADEYSFYVATDVHLSSKEKTQNIAHFLHTFRNDSLACFGTILGDCIDRKALHPAFVDALQYDSTQHRYDSPLMIVLGNHDTYFNGWDSFAQLIGPSVYYFTVGNDRVCDLYIVLDTATGTLGYKQTAWLKDFLHRNRMAYRHCVILTHSNFFNTDASQGMSGCLPLEETMQLISLFDNHNVTLVLQGHDHFREDLVMMGVRYTIVGALSEKEQTPEYLRVNVASQDVSYDWYYINQ